MTPPLENGQRERAERSVHVLAASHSLSENIADTLTSAGFHCVSHSEAASLIAALEAPVGALLLEEACVTPDLAAQLLAYLERQAPWSDLPILVVAKARNHRRQAALVRSYEKFGAVTILEAPLREINLISAVNTALRHRQRQYAVREHLTNQGAQEREVQRLNRALSERIQDLESLLSVVPVGVAVAEDPECKRVRLNPAGAVMLGVSARGNFRWPGTDENSPIRFERDGALLDPEEAPLQYAVRRNVPVSGRHFDVIREDGTRLNLCGYASPLHDEAGDVRGGVHVFVDVSERAQAEDQLRHLNETLELRVRERTRSLTLLRDIASAANSARTIEQAFQFALQRVCQENGWVTGLAWLPAHDDESLLEPVELHVESGEPELAELRERVRGQRVSRAAGLLGRVFESSVPQFEAEIEDEWQRRGWAIAGTFGVRELAAFPVLMRDEIVAVLEFGSASPVTASEALQETMRGIGNQLARVIERDRANNALDQSNRLIQQVTETTPALLHVYDMADQEVVYANARYHDFFELDGLRDSADRERPFAGRVLPDDAELLAETFSVLVDWQDHEPYIWPLRIQGPEGEVRWLRNWTTPFTRSETGEVRRILNVSLDVTDQVHAEERLRHNERLTSIGTLAAGITHEINNPLASVLMTAQLLRRRNTDPDTDEMLGDLITDTKRCARIVRSVQQFARQEPADFEVQDLNEIVSNTIELAEPEFRRRKIHLVLELAPELPAINAATAELEQALLNLLRNALAASAEGQEVLLRTSQVGSRVECLVEDYGAGMSEEVRRRAFEPFFTTHTGGVGAGLGLSIVHGIISDHGGRISIDSTPGEGTLVRLRFPVAEQVAEEAL